MDNVIKVDFKKIDNNYDYKKISQDGVETLEELRHFLMNNLTISKREMPFVIGMLTDVLVNEIYSKHLMTKGNEEI